MHIRTVRRYGRQGWELESDALTLFLMAGGGHLAGLRVKGGPDVNPFWIPVWKGIEPWQYKPADAKRYGAKLLACIAGHNLCLGAFGNPSEEEARAGLQCHGEAPVARWRVLRKTVSARGLRFVYGCELPIAQMTLTRTLAMTAGSAVIRVREQIVNRARRDVPFTMCQHVTFGPPFLEAGVTLFDMPATRGQTFPGVFAPVQRLKESAAFAWPKGPGVKGSVDLRTAGKRPYGDYTAHLMDPKQEYAWFSAVNPRQGLLVAYVWRRADYPWLGMWEEHNARKEQPWAGRSFTRGMEFANSPFPVGLRQAVDRGTFQGQRTYRWLPALGRLTFDYAILALPTPRGCQGVAAIEPVDEAFKIAWR